MNEQEHKGKQDHRDIAGFGDDLGDVRFAELFFLILSALCFLISLPLPVAAKAFATSSSDVVRGYMFVLSFPVVFPAGWANPFLFGAWICGYYRKSGWLFVCGIAAMGLGLTVLAMSRNPGALLVGYHVWLVSLGWALLAGLVKPIAYLWNDCFDS